LAKAGYRGVQAAVEIDYRAIGPEAPDEVLAGDHLSRIFQQRRQDLKRLLLKAKPDAVLAQFGGGHIHLEGVKPDSLRGTSRLRHLEYCSAESITGFTSRVVRVPSFFQ
jgi:hypothetical protein